MKIIHITEDIFNYNDGEYLIALSADLKCDVGLVKEFDKLYRINSLLTEAANNVNYNWNGEGRSFTIQNGLTTINALIVKSLYNRVPDIKNIRQAFEHLKNMSILSKRIIMPKICCGDYDKLSWKDIEAVIVDVFKDTDWEFIICSL